MGGKATKHNFSGGHGYVAPKGARADQQELVNKFFSKKSEQSESFECVKSEVVQVQQKVESKVEFSSGEDRRKEALERRQEFLKQNEDLHMQIKSSDFKMTNVKTRQQLEEERESFFKNTVLKVQQEAQLMSSRAKDDEMKRIEYLKSEEERIKREEILRQEAMLRAEEERKQKELARQEELRKQKMEMAKQREEMERERLLKQQQEEQERLKKERLRLEEERKRAAMEKSQVSQKIESKSNLEELRRQEELKRMERQRLEQMIIQESKVVSGQVSKRIDDVSGLGWGNVKTGFVSKKKLGFLQREMSVDRDSETGSPLPGGKTRGLRVTFADSPNGSRPTSTLGWTERVAEMDVRAQTPPLAGEWATGNSVQQLNGSNSSFIQKTSSGQAQTFASQETSSGQAQSFASQKTSSMQAKSFASQQSSSFQSSQSSTFSSVQKTSFSSSQSSQSSIQASSAFEAFPGLGRIENLKIE